MDRNTGNRLAVAILHTLPENGAPESIVYLAAAEKLGMSLDDYRAAMAVFVKGGLFKIFADQVFPGPKFAEVHAALMAHEAKS